MKILYIFVLSLICSVSSQSGCTGTVNGFNYDFTALSATTDYNITGGTSNKWMIRVNMCKGLSSMGTPPCTQGASACQWWDVPNPAYVQSLGLANTMSISQLVDGSGHKGFTASFTGGLNIDKKTPIKMEINFICSSGSGNGSPTSTQTTGNDYKFDWNTAAACIGSNSGGGGGGGGITGGAVFLILLFCIPTVYLVSGVIVNKFIRHQEGMEIIPNMAFWAAFGGLIKDGVKFIGAKTCRRGGYAQV